MADVILNRKQIQHIMECGQVDARYSCFEDRAFLPVSLAIDVIEKEKKGSDKIPSELKSVIEHIPECVSVIPLSQRGLYEAMNNPEFSDKYSNRLGNPIEMATEASVYEYDGWWDRVELLNSFMQLTWI